MREALWLIEQGVASPEDIDATVRAVLRLPLRCRRSDRAEGAFGLRTTCAVAKIIWPDLNNADGPPPVLQRNVDQGRIGFKTKRGFFDWDDASMAKSAQYERACRKCRFFREEGFSSTAARTHIPFGWPAAAHRRRNS